MQRGFFVYAPCRSRRNESLAVRENVSIFVTVEDFASETDIFISESVSLILVGNLENFKNTRINATLITVFRGYITGYILCRCGVLFILYSGLPEPPTR